MKSQRSTILLIQLVWLCVVCSPSQNISEKVRVGDTKQHIRESLGKPQQIQIIRKTTDIIWGAEEAFWDKIGSNEQLKVWIYPVGKNRLQLYFRENNNKLFYKIVVDPNVVYESENSKIE